MYVFNIFIWAYCNAFYILQPVFEEQAYEARVGELPLVWEGRPRVLGQQFSRAVRMESQALLHDISIQWYWNYYRYSSPARSFLRVFLKLCWCVNPWKRVNILLYKDKFMLRSWYCNIDCICLYQNVCNGCVLKNACI